MGLKVFFSSASNTFLTRFNNFFFLSVLFYDIIIYIRIRNILFLWIKDNFSYEIEIFFELFCTIF